MFPLSRRWFGLPAIALAALFLLAGGARAALIETEPKSGITIDVRTPFNMVLPNGDTPVHVRIKNGSGSDGQWRLVFESPANRFTSARTQAVTSRFTARVAAGSSREFDVLVPMQTAAAGSHASNWELALDVVGPGVSIGHHSFSSSSHSGGRALGNIGFSEKLIGHQASDLSAALKAKGIVENFPVGEPGQIPADWRALSAFDQMWMTAGEWDALPADLRLAFEQWIATGGTLYLCASGASEPERKSGLGAVRTFPLDSGGALDLAKLIEKMEKPGLPPLGDSLTAYSSGWLEKAGIPLYRANAPLLTLVIVLFGILVGPVNFFLIAGREKRARIFWTTPLISVAGTVVICLTIFVQDGFGGWGRRHALIVIQPDRHSEVVVQEQASKTGVLPSAGFRLDPSALIRLLPTGQRSLRCSVDGAEYGGDWFQSRSVQGQMITAVRPTRAEIRLLNPEEVAAGAPPRIMSQIAEQLDRVYFMTDDGRVFRAVDVGPGRETAMTPGELRGATGDLKSECFGFAGPRVRELAGFPDLQKGWFYGISKSARNAMLPTLGTIRWTDDRALYLCPATPTP